MSSSISSFKNEAKVLATVVLALLAVECVMRAAQTILSVDVRHILSASELAEGMRGQAPPKVLALGNSLLREGVNPRQLAEESRRLGITESMTLYHPDGTGVQEWAFAFRKYFMAAESAPDCVLVFTGRTHLRDTTIRPTPLGAFYCATRDIPRFLTRDGSNLETASEFFLSWASVAYAQRERIQPRIFTAAIPHYQTMLRDMNARRSVALSDSDFQWTYHDLEWLLSSIQATGAQTFIVTVPAPDSYTLAPEIIALARSHHATILDLAGTDGLSRANFPDGWHLDSVGASLFTTRLADAIVAIPELARPR